MKWSNFNFLFTVTKNKERNLILYNSLYGSAILLPKRLKLRNLRDESPETVKLLESNNFLIDDNINEIDLIKSQNKLQRFNERTLELTILPTMWCNLRCVYCYENKRKETMTDDDINTIYTYIRNKAKQINSLSLLWFGGEPLLQVGKIKALSKRLIQLARRNKIQFKNSIITNGVLLNNTVCRTLFACGIKYVQITLDGSPKVHDRRRPTTNGKGTFKLIFDNLLNAINYFDVSVRVNIDENNKRSVKELIDILASFNLQNKLYVYVAKVEKIQGACESVGGACLDDWDFLNTEKKILAYLDKKGFKKVAVPSYRANYCTADNIHSFTILPGRKVYKCWHLVSDKKEVVGELVNNKINFNQNIYKWLSYDPLDNKACLKCKYLPLCMGGCPKIKLIEGKTRCDQLKNSLIKYIESLIASNKSSLRKNHS